MHRRHASPDTVLYDWRTLMQQLSYKVKQFPKIRNELDEKGVQYKYSSNNLTDHASSHRLRRKWMGLSDIKSINLTSFFEKFGQQDSDVKGLTKK
jgi:hypothetical protein